MDYPSDFPEHLKVKVDATIHRSERDYIEARSGGNRYAPFNYVEQIFFGFARQCVEAGRQGIWSGERIRKALHEFLEDLIDRTFLDKDPLGKQDPTSRYQFRKFVLQESSNWGQWREIHDQLAQVFTPADCASVSPPGDIDEKARRGGLLADYKSATGNPSNKKIYEARNSGIHKPQFYSWLKGTLPGGSATAINFERFLREKRSPIPKK